MDSFQFFKYQVNIFENFFRLDEGHMAIFSRSDEGVVYFRSVEAHSTYNWKM